MSRQRKANSTDPRRLNSQGIVGPGGPDDRGGVVMDADNAVLVEAFACAKVDDAVPVGPSSVGGEDVIALSIGGRINGSRDHATVLFLVSESGLAAIAEEISALRTTIARHKLT